MLFDPESAGTELLPNIGNNSPVDTAQHPRRP